MHAVRLASHNGGKKKGAVALFDEGSLVLACAGSWSC